jgi:ferredoxin
MTDGRRAIDRPPLVPVADRPAHPNTGHSPERVVRTVLEGLREPDTPAEDDGLRSAYHLCTPDYRTSVGGFDRFRDRMESALFRPLVGHVDADRGALDVNDAVTEATQPIVAVTDDADEYTFEFTLVKQADGKYADCWLVAGIDLLSAGRRPGLSHMPTVEFDGREIKCEAGARLRDVLLRAAGLNPHNDATAYANCGGNGLCGTCTVEIMEMDAGEGGNVSEPSGQEGRRMKLPPLRGSDVPNLRLSCQTRVYDDIRVTKHAGLWGQHLSDVDADVNADGDADTDEPLPNADADGTVITVSPAEYDPS